MRLNEMLNNYINQSSASVKNGGTTTLQQLPKQIAAQIRALAPGQILQGEVVEKLGDTIKLLVNMNGENVPLQARLEQSMMLNVGRSLLFQVKNNGSVLSLSPLFENMGMEQNALKALETASLPVNETTMELTARMMQEGISIDKNTLQEMYHHVVSNQDAEIMDIIDLYKLELPITPENLNQIHSYKAMTHQLVGGVEQMSQEFIDLLQDMVQNGQGKNAEALLRAVLGQNSEIQSAASNVPEIAAKTVLTEDAAVNLQANEGVMQESTVVNQKLTENVQLRGNQPEAVNSEALKDIRNMTGEQLLKELLTQWEASGGQKENLVKLLQREDFQAGIKEWFQKQLLLSPAESDKDGVQELYQKLNKQLQVVSDALQQVGQEQSALGKTVQNLNQNVQFLNQMNQMYAYIQLPLKLAESNAHGELYVYSNKKHLAGNDGEVTALLHLDMEHLGPVDVYVRMKESNVSTNFYIADEEMLDFLYEHMDMLTERLAKRGYRMSYHLTVKGEQDGTGNSTFKELLQENSNIPTLVNYSFDVRC